MACRSGALPGCIALGIRDLYLGCENSSYLWQEGSRLGYTGSYVERLSIHFRVECIYVAESLRFGASPFGLLGAENWQGGTVERFAVSSDKVSL